MKFGRRALADRLGGRLAEQRVLAGELAGAGTTGEWVGMLAGDGILGMVLIGAGDGILGMEMDFMVQVGAVITTTAGVGMVTEAEM